jgi:hypothetical protein
MRDSLHVCIGRTVLRAAIIGAVLVVSTPAMAAGKVLRPEAADGVQDRGAAESKQAATTSATPAAAAPPPEQPAVAPAKPVAKGKAVLDPNAAEPLSERAQAALDRAKQALAEEEAGDFVPEPQAVPSPVPQVIAGQPAKAQTKSASAVTKPAVKCVAGC